MQQLASEPWFPSSENAFTVFAAITHDCNLKCLHCFSAVDGEEKQTILNDEEWFILFDQLAELEKPRLFFTGGEPLVHPSFMKLAAYASNKSIPIILGTNATFITPSVSKELSGAGIKEARVSIDGASATTHDLLRGDGAFEKAKQGLFSLIDEGISVSIRTTVNKWNYQELSKIEDLVVQWNVFDWEIKHIIPTGRALLNPELQITSKERAISLKPILERAVTNFYPQLKIKLMEGTLSPDIDVPESLKIASCPAGSRMMVVQPTGDVIPCGYLASSYIGNIKQKSLSEIRAEWDKRPTFTLPTGCISCKHKKSCKGGCPAFNFCAED